jgi:hypothetical protein
MRDESAIQDRLRFLLTKELDRTVAESRARLPHKCEHNHRQPLDVRKEIAGTPNENYNKVSAKHLPIIGLCMLGADDPSQWNGTICEDPIDAQRCPYYSDPTATSEAVQKEFNRNIKDLVWVEKNLPEAYGLLWALGTEAMPSLPWWKALWFKVIRVRPDPLSLPPPSSEA